MDKQTEALRAEIKAHLSDDGALLWTIGSQQEHLVKSHELLVKIDAALALPAEADAGAEDATYIRVRRAVLENAHDCLISREPRYLVEQTINDLSDALATTTPPTTAQSAKEK